MQQIDVQGRRQIGRQPIEQQIKHVVIRAKSERETQHLALRKKLAQRRRFFVFVFPRAVRTVAVFNVTALDLGQFRVVAGIAIDAPEVKKVGEADDAGKREAPAPSGVDEHDPDERNADGRGKLCRCIGERCGETALARRKPEADGLGVRRKCRRFAHAEQETRAKEAAQVGRNRRRKRSRAPEKSAHAPHAPHAEFVENRRRWAAGTRRRSSYRRWKDSQKPRRRCRRRRSAHCAIPRD